ncbi:MAG: hypothetical protein L3I91_01845 [Mycoplasma sp.]
MSSSVAQQNINQTKLKLVRDLNSSNLNQWTNYVRLFSGYTLMICMVGGIILILFYAIESVHQSLFLTIGYSLIVFAIVSFLLASAFNIAFVNQVIKYKLRTMYDMWFISYFNLVNKVQINKQEKDLFVITNKNKQLQFSFNQKRKILIWKNKELANKEQQFLKHHYQYDLKYLFYKTSTYYQSCLKQAIDQFMLFIIKDNNYLSQLMKQ